MYFNQKVDTLFAVADRKFFFAFSGVYLFKVYLHYFLIQPSYPPSYLELYYFFELRDVGDCLSSVSCSAQAIFEPYAAKRAWVSAKGVCLESVNKKPPQRNLSYTIAILELLPYSRTLGVPDSFYARFNIVSNKCHPAPCNLNSDKLFLTLSDQYSNPGGFSNPVPLVSTIS